MKFFSSICEDSVTLTPKSDEAFIRRENYRLMYHINKMQILNTRLENQILRYLKKVIYYNQVEFITVILGRLLVIDSTLLNTRKLTTAIHHTSKINKQNCITSINVENLLYKIL